MKKTILLLLSSICSISGVSLLLFNLLHISYETVEAHGSTFLRRGTSGPVAITGYYYYEEGYIIGATVGVALLIAGYFLGKKYFSIKSDLTQEEKKQLIKKILDLETELNREKTLRIKER